MELGIEIWSVLIVGAVAAGWIDALIGGGGLIMIPWLLACVPNLAPTTALGTNKLVSVSGTSTAAYTMVRKAGTRINYRYVPIAAACSAGGAAVASLIDASILRPLIIILLITVGTFVALRPDFGEGSGRPVVLWKSWVALLLVGVIGFYDGIFGPGTGLFLIMTFTALLSKNFLESAVLTKVVNTSTNLGGLAVFIINGHVWWQLGLVLAVSNIVGAQLGARTVLGGGVKLIRIALLVVVIVMSSYLTWQQFFS